MLLIVKYGLHQYQLSMVVMILAQDMKSAYHCNIQTVYFEASTLYGNGDSWSSDNEGLTFAWTKSETLLALVWCLQPFASKVILVVYNNTYICTREINTIQYCTIQFHYILYKFLFLLFIWIKCYSIYLVSLYLMFCLCKRTYTKARHIMNKHYALLKALLHVLQ